jgi:hypothetical protein
MLLKKNKDNPGIGNRYSNVTGYWEWVLPCGLLGTLKSWGGTLLPYIQVALPVLTQGGVRRLHYKFEKESV